MAMRLLKRHRVGLVLLGLVVLIGPRDLDIKLTFTADIVAAQQGDMA
ncbi:MAG TPA: hypothetical protein VK746_19155 [Candidatus Eisenbacteria bacterium]|jgi:hypothetical protein|nr:hypothetical protein [Candidatus Eisenbacteria bacterium]